MDKQKQIEELANIIDDCTWVTDEDYCENTSCQKCNATRLYNAGYRKIPENAVVLTREHEDEIFSLYVEYIKKIRKETAEKFAERMKNIFKYEAHQQWIDEICKEITEGKE